MKKLILIISLSIVPYLGYSQVDTISKSWKLFITPTSLFNPLYPAVHLGIEKEMDEWSGLVEMGILTRYSLYRNNESVLGFQDFSAKNKGFFIKVEGKRLLNKYLYAGVNLQFLMNNYERTDTFDETPDLTSEAIGTNGIFLFCSTCIEETYKIKKNMIGASLKFGFMIGLSKSLYMDGYLGLGFNYHMNTHSINTELHRNPARADGLISYYDVHYPGSYIFHLPVPVLGLRVGYKLN